MLQQMEHGQDGASFGNGVVGDGFVDLLLEFFGDVHGLTQWFTHNSIIKGWDGVWSRVHVVSGHTRP